MSIQKAEGFVLKTHDFRETSLIAVFYTKEFGKLKGVLKGIKTDPKKFSSTLQKFSLNDIIFYKSRTGDLHLIGQCDLVENFPLIRENLEALSFANYALELIDSLMETEDKNYELFETLSRFLRELSVQNEDIEKIFCIFQIKALEHSGFKPNIEDCISCKKTILDEARFSLSRGGLLCAKCSTEESFSRDILKGTIASIDYINKNGWDNLKRFKISPSIKNEIKEILNNFLSFHLEKRIKSARFIDKAFV